MYYANLMNLFINPSTYLFQFDLINLLICLNGYAICLNTTNCLIFNMQDFRNGLFSSFLSCFGQVVSQGSTWCLAIHLIFLWHGYGINSTSQIVHICRFQVKSKTLHYQSFQDIPRFMPQNLFILNIVIVY